MESDEFSLEFQGKGRGVAKILIPCQHRVQVGKYLGDVLIEMGVTAKMLRARVRRAA
jgi:hypothetical protein